MGTFSDYVKELFEWNEQMKQFLEAEKVGLDSELWEQLDGFTELIENASRELSDEELLALQTKAEKVHEQLESYFRRKQDTGYIWTAQKHLLPGGHQLPDLPYPYQALEPYISEEIMRLHHGEHHRSYVDGLNKAELQLKKAREESDFSLIRYWSRELAFHGSGHYLHSIFWRNMSPTGGGSPHGLLHQEIDHYFGSFVTFKKQFSEAAKQVAGAGWALLVWSPAARHLEILQTESHMKLTQWDTVPILVLDVWEHAYYPQYKNNRAGYVESWWNIVNWNDVEMRFEKAAESKWPSL